PPTPRHAAARDEYVYSPGNHPVSEWQAVLTRGRSFVIEALADIPAAGAQGVLFAQGSRFGGHALYVKDNRLHYVNSYVGIEEQAVVGDEGVPTRDKVVLAAAFEKESQEPTATKGTLTLYHGEKKGGQGEVTTQMGAF